MTSISQQSSLPSPPPTSASASQAGTTAKVPSPSLSPSATPPIPGSAAAVARPAVPTAAAATARSYANATKKPATPAIVSGASAALSAPPVAVTPAVQHAKSYSVAAVNGRTAGSSPASAASPPDVVNGTGPHPAIVHSRKSSVTISAAGASGYLPNGAPARPSNIQFGSLDAGASPVTASASPPTHQATPSGPVAAPHNPRVISPQSSPSPIPQPPASGGRPPTGLPGHANNMSFGSLPGDGADGNRSMRPMSMPPQAPLNLGPQPSHLRRESSQSTHSEAGNAAIPPGQGPARQPFGPNGGRGRGYGPNYPSHGQMTYPSGAGYRGPPSQPRANLNPQFSGQAGPMGPYPNSPRSTRSPALTHSVPGTPQMQQVPMANAQMQPPHYAYGPNMAPPHTQYQFDPAYAGAPYPPQQYMMPGMYLGGPAPSSPRPPHQPHGYPGPQPPYVIGQYNGPAQPAPMSRTSSAVSDQRPNSSLGQQQQQAPPTASAANPAVAAHPASGRDSPALAANFVRPARKSAGIVIKDPHSGAVKTFDKAPPSPARSPAIVSSTPPPPVLAQSSAAHHLRTESKSVKSDEEKKNEMRDAISKKIEAEKAAKEQEDADERAREQEAADRARREAEAKAKAKADADAAEAEKLAADERARSEAEAKARAEAEAKAEAQRKADDEAARAAAAAEAEAKRQREAAAVAADEEAKEAGASADASTTEEKGKAPAAGVAAGLAKLSIESANSDEAMGPPNKPASAGKRDKPAALNLTPLKTNSVEPPQPSAAMQSLRSARFIDRISDVSYPKAFASPNPALNKAASKGKFKYDQDFLMQFQPVFTEKPSVDWENRLKDSVGETAEAARSAAARSSTMGPRNTSSGRAGLPSSFSMGTFGQGAGSRPVPATSAERFAEANRNLSQGRAPMSNPLAQYAGKPGGFSMAGPSPMSRTNSSTALPSQGGGGGAGPHSPRGGAARNSRRDNMSKRNNTGEKQASRREEEQAARTMPLTAGVEVKPIQVSATGWKPRSLQGVSSATGAAGPAPGASEANASHLDPDMVQRKVKANLNKMTPEKFDKIANQILEIAAQSKDESDGRTLRQVIQLTFEKATDEAHWAPMYARFCTLMLDNMNPDIKDESIRDKNGNVVAGGNLFRKYLLNRCQEEFERGWKINLPAKPQGETEEAAMLSEEYYIAAAAKRRGLGLVQFIGELYKLGMLTERIMHECVKKLVDYDGVPDEAEVESLTKLLRTIGANLDLTEKGHPLMDIYFQRIQAMMDTPELPSRLKFMLLDVVDLRKRGWDLDQGEKGPRTIQAIRAEVLQQQAEKEAEKARQQSQRHHQGGRMAMGRGDARSFSGGGQYGMMPPPDLQRNTVGMDDLRRLGSKAGSRQASQGGPPSLGPTAMFSSRSNSGRKTLGSLGRGGEDSGASSRTGTPPAAKEKEATTSANAFSALAGLDASGEAAGATSPPGASSMSPPVSKAKPTTADKTTKAGEKRDDPPAGTS